jgi:multicomponent Na+:H+ antiporter subunit D
MENNLFLLGSVFITFIAAVLALAFARQNRIQRWIGFFASLLAWGCSLVVVIQVFDQGPQIYQMGGFQAPFGIVLVADGLSSLFLVMASTVMFGGMIYALHFRDNCGTFPAFMPLFLMMETGLNGAFMTGDLFSMFVFIELMVLASVSLVAISDDRLGLEAAIKYIFISGMGTLFLLLGIAAMYASFGTLNLAQMAMELNGSEPPLLASSAGIMLAGAFLLKSAVFPFHFWQPDFHTTAPTPVHAVLSSVVVKVGVYGVLRMITLLFVDNSQQLQDILIVLGVVGIFFGSLGALRTYNGKRMLAYSTIGQIGFIMVAIGWGTPLALAAAIVYAFNHAFIKSALLMIMGLVSSRTKPKSADFAEIQGVGKKMPIIISILWFVGGMALAGVPPMNGFISKLVIVTSGVDAGQWVALGLAVGAGILTLMYMFGSWQQVFQQKVEKEAMKVKIKPEGDSVLAPTLLITIAFLLGIYARPLIMIAERAAIQLGDNNIYIQAVLGG